MKVHVCHQGTEIHICVCKLSPIYKCIKNIYKSNTTRGTPQDTYEHNDSLIESPVHLVVEAHQPSPANIYTYMLELYL